MQLGNEETLKAASCALCAPGQQVVRATRARHSKGRRYGKTSEFINCLGARKNFNRKTGRNEIHEKGILKSECLCFFIISCFHRLSTSFPNFIHSHPLGLWISMAFRGEKDQFLQDRV